MTAPWTKAEMVARHPWPAGLDKPKLLDWFWHFDVPTAPAALWPAIADSSRLNRALGVAEMKFEEREGRRWGTSKPGGFRHAWVEVPWNWVAGQWLESVRIYERGFMRAVFAAYHLEPIASGTRLYIYFGAVPRGFFGGLALRYGFPSLERGYRKVLPQIADAIAKTRPVLLALPAPTLDPGAEARLSEIALGLRGRGLDHVAIERLVDWVRTGDEQDLYRIQVRERARAWDLDEDAVLRVALHATRLGLLELSWDVVCPHCRGVTDENRLLAELPTAGGCGVCGIEFGTDEAEAVEITFHVHPSIRDIPKRTFCSAEPATKDHIRVQLAIAPGATTEVMPVLPVGRYRMRIGSDKRYGFLDVGPGTNDNDRDGAIVEWRSAAAPSETAAPGAPRLRLVNDASEDRTFVLEAAQWTDLALRPGKLLSFQDFRDLYGAEYLGADVQLAIGEQTILFTDMVGSTAMYATRGDPAAFVEVKRHFNDVFGAIAANRGAVVKTIGDAAMGAFNDPLDAVKAAAAIQRAFPPGRDDTVARLRISINTGPCIAVHLNTAIDYFGHTVNVAAKLQALAETWQIALAETTYRAPGVAAWLAAEGAVLEELAYSSKAIPEPIAVKRWTLFRE